MPEMRVYPQGTPCWMELEVRDRGAAVSFYGAVFGWEFGAPQLQHMSYSSILSRGKTIAGLIVPGERVPVAWTTFLASDDAHAAADTITACGGRVIMDVMEVAGEGRMLIGADPTGAVFGVWQGEPDSQGSQLVNEPGAPVWHELVTPDAAAARTFYAAVFGVGISPPISDDLDYTTLLVNGRDVGGIWRPDDPQPARWSVYFGTADTDATAAAVRAAGGKTVREPTDTPYGRTATFMDPQGAEFAVMSTRAE